MIGLGSPTEAFGCVGKVLSALGAPWKALGCCCLGKSRNFLDSPWKVRDRLWTPPWKALTCAWTPSEALGKASEALGRPRWQTMCGDDVLAMWDRARDASQSTWRPHDNNRNTVTQTTTDQYLGTPLVDLRFTSVNAAAANKQHERRRRLTCIRTPIGAHMVLREARASLPTLEMQLWQPFARPTATCDFRMRRPVIPLRCKPHGEHARARRSKAKNHHIGHRTRARAPRKRWFSALGNCWHFCVVHVEGARAWSMSNMVLCLMTTAPPERPMLAQMIRYKESCRNVARHTSGGELQLPKCCRTHVKTVPTSVEVLPWGGNSAPTRATLAVLCPSL